MVKLLILPNGDIEAVYDDRLAQLKLGPITSVRRASHVEFDVASQQWEARDADTGDVLCRHVSRAQCVELEKEIVHQKLRSKHD